jgi:hypothetical protein
VEWFEFIRVLKASNYIDIELDISPGGSLVDALTTRGKAAAGRL